ncbi:MAG: DUF2225 domain-containing protein [Spirochaetia bacterium]
MSGSGKVSFFSKKTTTCPVCSTQFNKEEMHTGRGRLIAGDLTIELRRNYEASQKYGEVFPIIYTMIVCPGCYFSAFPADFESVNQQAIGALEGETQNRIARVEKLFPDIDFHQPRGIEEGAASYLAGMFTYEHFDKENAPTFKQGLCALRAAWACNDLHKKKPNDNYDYLSKVFYRKAAFLYSLAVEYEQSGEEALPSDFHFGPDTDKNYGYDGVLYISGFLVYKYGPKKNPEKRKESLEKAKRIVARIFGMGKASKDKPAAILDNARDLFAKINNELKENFGSDEA